MAYTIAKGTEVSYGDSSSSVVDSVALSTSKALVLHCGFDSPIRHYLSVATITGLVVSMGSQVALDTAEVSADPDRCGIAPNNASEAAVLYVHDTGSQDDLRARVVSVSGSVPTPETHLEIYTNISTSNAAIDNLVEDKYICLLQKADSGQRVEAFVMTQSGTTLTAQTPTTIQAANGGNAPMAIKALSSTRALAHYHDTVATAGTKLALLSISGNTVTVEDTLKIPSSIGGSSALSLTALSSTKAVVLYYESGVNWHLVVVDTTGDTITLGTKLSVDNDTRGVGTVDATTVITGRRGAEDDFLTFTISGTDITSDANDLSMTNNINTSPSAILLDTVGGKPQVFATWEGSNYAVMLELTPDIPELPAAIDPGIYIADLNFSGLVTPAAPFVYSLAEHVRELPYQVRTVKQHNFQVDRFTEDLYLGKPVGGVERVIKLTPPYTGSVATLDSGEDFTSDLPDSAVKGLDLTDGV